MSRLFTHRSILSILVVLLFCRVAFANEPKPITLLLPELKGHHGKSLPIQKEVKILVSFFERETGLRFEIKTVPWNRVKWMIENGDGIAYGISKAPERLSIYHYSLPIKKDKVWAITHGATSLPINSVDDLRGRKVLMTRGTTYGLEFEQAKGQFFEVTESYNITPEHLLNLLKDTKNVVLWSQKESLDAQQFTTFFHSVALPSYNMPGLATLQFNVSSKPIFFDTIHFASGKNKFKVEMDLLDKAISRSTQNGVLAKILYGEK
ncbi:substrate-binding periplasmic protein [Undibacterium sp.]|uniref:substrate-binding periplasmic protein n=1 Tax=Undibacterium sp. TaxID=1914977 RepID=UPI003753AFAE